VLHAVLVLGIGGLGLLVHGLVDLWQFGDCSCILCLFLVPFINELLELVDSGAFVILHFSVQLDYVFYHQAELLFGVFLLLFAGSLIGVFFWFFGGELVLLDGGFCQFLAFGLLHIHRFKLREVLVQNGHDRLFADFFFLDVLYLLVGSAQFLLLLVDALILFLLFL
jgi:hypothetical protein